MIERSRNQQMDIRKEEKSRLKREEMAFVEQWKAGAYTRPLFSSTCAVSDTKYTRNTP